MMRAVSWKIWIYLYVYPSKSHSFIQFTNFNLNVTYFQLTFKLVFIVIFQFYYKPRNTFRNCLEGKKSSFFLGYNYMTLNDIFIKYYVWEIYFDVEHIQIQDLCYDRMKIYEDNFITVEKIMRRQSLKTM